MRAFLLVGSLVLNATLASVAFMEGNVLGEEPPAQPGRAPRISATTTAEPEAGASELELLSAALRSSNDEQVIASIRALDVPKEMQDSLIDGYAGNRAMKARKELHEHTPFWKGGRDSCCGADSFSAKAYEVAEKIRKQAGLSEERYVRGLRGGYDVLPAEKRAVLAAVLSDYEDLRMQAINNAHGFLLPSDKALLKELEQESKADVDALLTAEDRALMHKKASNLSRHVSGNYGAFIDDEGTYERVFAVMDQLVAKYGDDALYEFRDDTRPEAERAQLQADREQAELQARAIIGEERFRAQAEQNDGDRETVKAACARLNLPYDAAFAQLAASRTEAIAESQRIVEDGALSADAKKAAQKALAARVKERLVSVFGAEGTETLADRVRWLDNLADGRGLQAGRYPEYGDYRIRYD